MPRKPSKKPAAKALVKAVIPNTEGHAYQTMEEDDSLPTLKSVGYARVAPNSRDYVAYVITSRGREVLSIEVSEPNLKAIAADESKINFVTLFEDQDQTLEEDRRHIEEEEKVSGRA